MFFAARWLVRAQVALVAMIVVGCASGKGKPVWAKRGLSEFVSTIKSLPDEQHGDRGRERRSSEPMVYVDGVPTAVLAYLELPASLPTRWQSLTSGKQVRRFRVAELFTALGIDLAAIKQVHLYGGRDRISILDGSELRRMNEEILFSFTQSDRGKPRMHYPDNALKVNTRIDLIDNIAVYVQREAPILTGKYATLTFADGVPIEGIPYASGERPGGTRIYIDGALRTFVKRRSLANAAVDPGASHDAPPRFPLRAYLETLGVQWKTIKTIEVLGSSNVLAKLDASALNQMPPLAFTLPKRSQGLVGLDLPAVTEPVQAIAIYDQRTPPDRAALARAPDASEKTKKE